jgi:antibiotic biosynthesis monooxygenase (ABM) superfamily enzyme
MKQSNHLLKKNTGLEPRKKVRNTAPRMVPWKQALVTVIGVYPLLLSYEWLAKQILPVQHLDRRITLLIIVFMIATTMVFLVMPFVVKILGRWLFKK